MNRKTLLLTALTAIAMATCSIVISGCTKEGPAGKDGANGADGMDGTASCITCHAPDGIELAATQYELSKHSYGEEAFSLAGNTGIIAKTKSKAFKIQMY